MRWGDRQPKWLVVGLVSVSWLSYQRPLLACNCVPLKSPLEALQEADAVFLGTVERFETNATDTAAATDGDVPRIATVRVKIVWKGIDGPLIDVTTASAGPVCGYDFIVGYDYLIYAHRSKEGMLTTSLCSRTRPDHEAQEDLQAFGHGSVLTSPVVTITWHRYSGRPSPKWLVADLQKIEALRHFLVNLPAAPSPTEMPQFGGFTLRMFPDGAPIDFPESVEVHGGTLKIFPRDGGKPTFFQDSKGLWTFLSAQAKSRGFGSKPAAESAALYPYLVSDRRAYFPAQNVNLSCSLRVPKEHTVRIEDSLLIVRDRTTRVVFSKQGACGSILGEETLSFHSSFEHGQLPHFEPGTYQAIWEVNGALSNAVDFEIVAGPICEEPPLTIEWLGRRHGMAHEPHLIMRLINTGTTPLELPDAYGNSTLYIDGKPSQLIMMNWNGPGILPPGKAWGTWLSFDDYEPRITPGSHQVQLEFAGQRSNILTINWEDQ